MEFRVYTWGYGMMLVAASSPSEAKRLAESDGYRVTAVSALSGPGGYWHVVLGSVALPVVLPLERR